jgi:hypothetical protein
VTAASSLGFRERLRRIAAIVKADVFIRFRRSSTLVVFLLLSGLAYVSIPDPATGRALLTIDHRRAVYNSAAIGMATALLVSIFVGLAGFYVISNAVARDVRSRCGLVIASTTMRSGEYVVAKAAGNLVFLTLFTAGFMVSSMAMLLVRNEAPLEPWVFVKQYLLIVPPALVLVAVLAIVFESVSFLSGRFGDVAYFVLFLVCLALPFNLALASGGSPFARYIDSTGLVFTFEQMQPLIKGNDVTIGSSRFDPLKPLIVLPGVTADADRIVARLVSLAAPLLLLVVAVRVFHRFDPAHVRKVDERTRSGRLARINQALKPLLRARVAFAPLAGRRSRQSSLLRAAMADARMTFASYPALLGCVLALAIAAILCPPGSVLPRLLPAAFFISGLAIADMSCRERRCGTLTLIYSSPALKSDFVWWKLIATMFVALAVMSVPLARLAVSHPASVPSVIAGVFFVASAATAMGSISVTPKTFTLVFLTLLYGVLSDGGASPALDFGGFYEKATPRIMLSYLVAASVLLLVAQGVHSFRLRRDT